MEGWKGMDVAAGLQGRPPSETHHTAPPSGAQGWLWGGVPRVTSCGMHAYYPSSSLYYIVHVSMHVSL